MKALVKFLSLFLTLCMVLSVAPVAALASENEAAAELLEEPALFEENETAPVILEEPEEPFADADPVAVEEMPAELPADEDEAAPAFEAPEALIESPVSEAPAEMPSFSFTKQPDCGTVLAGEYYTISWSTSFMPLRVWLYALEPGMETPLDITAPLQKLTDEELSRGAAEITPADNQLVLAAWYGEGEDDYVLSTPFAVTMDAAPELDKAAAVVPEVLPKSATILSETGDPVLYTFKKDPKCTICEDQPAFRISWETSYVPTTVNIELESGVIYRTLTDDLSTSMYFDLPFMDAVGSKVYVSAYVAGAGIRESGSIPWSKLLFSQQPAVSLNDTLSAFRISWATSYVPTMVEIGYISDNSFHSVSAYTESLGKSMTVDLPFDVAVHGEMIVRAYYRTEDWKESAAFTLPWDSLPSDIDSTSVSFNGKLNLNVYIKLSEEIEADADAYIITTFNGVTTTFYVADLIEHIESDGCVKVRQGMFAGMMRDEMTLQVFNGNGEIQPLTYKGSTNVTDGFVFTAVDYLRSRQQHSSNVKMQELARAAELYGAAVQVYFKYHMELLTAEDIAAVQAAAGEITIPKFNETEGTLPAGITDRSKTVLFEEDNTLRMYFNLDDAQLGNYSFSLNGEEATPVKKKAGEYYIQQPNIAPAILDTSYSFGVSDGTDSYTMETSVLAYAYNRQQKSSNPDMINLAKLLYRYYLAASDYFMN